MSDRTGPIARSPIARSPISIAAATEIVAGWELTTSQSPAALQLCDESHLTKVFVRAPADGAFATSIGVAMGRAARRPDATLAVGSGPGEWFVFARANTASSIRAELQSLAGDDQATVIDLTHGRALMRLSGGDAPGVLSKICAIDLRDQATPNGQALRTSVARIATDIVRDDGPPSGQSGSANAISFWLHCERSSGQYLFDCLLDAGREFEIEASGGSAEPFAH